MKNNRTLFPPLFGVIPTGGGGGGSGNKIQLTELPEASLQYKDKIIQYIGVTNETLTNGYFYKCVEHTTTEGETITVTYSWDNIPVMEVENGYNLVSSVMSNGAKTYSQLFSELVGEYVFNPNNYYVVKLGNAIYNMVGIDTSKNRINVISQYVVDGTFTQSFMRISNNTAYNYFYEDSDLTNTVVSNGRELRLYAISSKN